jgi:hypothetical protein
MQSTAVIAPPRRVGAGNTEAFGPPVGPMVSRTLRPFRPENCRELTWLRAAWNQEEPRVRRE